MRRVLFAGATRVSSRGHVLPGALAPGKNDLNCYIIDICDRRFLPGDKKVGHNTVSHWVASSRNDEYLDPIGNPRILEPMVYFEEEERLSSGKARALGLGGKADSRDVAPFG